MKEIIENNEHPKISFGKTAVLLINLGTPDSYNWWDIRNYLKEFLSDRRVIETNKILWFFLLNFIILNFRPHKTAKNYKKIWLKKDNMSPLKFYTKLQRDKLRKILKKENVLIDYAMRYGSPSIKNKTEVLRALNDKVFNSKNDVIIELPDIMDKLSNMDEKVFERLAVLGGIGLAVLKFI